MLFCNYFVSILSLWKWVNVAHNVAGPEAYDWANIFSRPTPTYNKRIHDINSTDLLNLDPLLTA